MSESGREDHQHLLERFNAAVAGAELDDLRRLADVLLPGSGAAGAALPPRSSPRPSRRRPRRDDVVTLRVRVDLDDARPPIWRRLDLRSDLTLDAVHEVLQAAFAWNDSHLHRFALGAGVFDPDAEQFLCPWEVEEGDAEGVPAAQVRLDEALAEPGDVLRYCYDYGDSWDLTLELEEVLPFDDSLPGAVCVDGRRAAPPEDCGGVRDAAELAEVLPDPASFDAGAVNRALTGPYGELSCSGLTGELVELLRRLRGTEVGDELAVRASGLGMRVDRAPSADRAAALRPYLWFLDRVGDDGLPLTAAGYLKPVDVSAAAEVVPGGPGWIGAKNREIDTYPVLLFRERLQQLGLTRRQKGRLLLTRAGAAARSDADVLWTHLASRLPLGRAKDGSSTAGLLALLLLASAPEPVVADATLARALTALGWREGGGTRPIGAVTARVTAGDTLEALASLTSSSGGSWTTALSPVAADLAARALLTSP